MTIEFLSKTWLFLAVKAVPKRSFVATIFVDFFLATNRSHKTRAEDVDEELFASLEGFGLTLVKKTPSSEITAQFAHDKIAIYEFELIPVEVVSPGK